MIKLVIPEEAQSTRAIQRQLLQQPEDRTRGLLFKNPEVQHLYKSQLSAQTLGYGSAFVYLGLVCKGLQVRVVSVWNKAISVMQSHIQTSVYRTYVTRIGGGVCEVCLLNLIAFFLHMLVSHSTSLRNSDNLS